MRLRTARSGDPASEHTFLNLWANSSDSASAEVQFASMMRREPFIDRAKRLELLNSLNALSTTTWTEPDVDMRVPFRLRDLRDGQRLQRFLDIWREYLNDFHSMDISDIDPEEEGEEDRAPVELAEATSRRP